MTAGHDAPATGRNGACPRYVRDHSAGARAVSVQCLGCSRMVRLADAVIDTQGPAFQAYYCEACVPHVWRPLDALRARCEQWDCAVCPRPRDVAVPELEHGSGSWIVTAPDGRVVELFEREDVEKAARAGWRIETAGQYLGRINRGGK